MQLFMSPTSPYARKIRILLQEKRVPFEAVVDIPWNEGSAVPALNPLAKIPVLVLDDGRSLFDSRVIVQYLDSAYPEPAFIPAATDARIDVLRCEALADGLTDAAVAISQERKRPAEQQDAAWIARQRAKIDRALATANAELAGRSWWAGDRYGLADVALGCALGYVDLRLQLPWRDEYPQLKGHNARLGERPAFAETAPPQ